MSASHPTVVALSADAFAVTAPALRTTAADKGDGNHEIQLLWSPSGEVVLPGEERRASEVVVGELEFFLGISSMAGGGGAARGKLERLLGARVALLQNVHVLKQLRGQGGGDMLVRGMVDALAALWADTRDSSSEAADTGGFVALRHLDSGSGKLLRWYGQLGFVFARETQAGAEGAAGEDLMVAPLATLTGRLHGQRF